MTITRTYAGKYEINHKGQKYFAVSVNYGQGTRWNLYTVYPCEVFGEREEWGNTYMTLRDLKESFE